MAGDSFFQSDRKRKRPSNKGPTTNQKQSRPSSSSAPKRKSRDEELSSGSDDDRADLDGLDLTRDDVGANATRYDSGEEEELNRNETAGEKRIRLAKGYLNKIKDEVANRVDDGTFDAADIDRELIAARLKQDVDEQSGAIHVFLHPRLAAIDSPSTTIKRHFLPALKGHAVTASHASPSHLYIAHKTGSVVRYDLRTMRLSGNVFGQAGSNQDTKGKEKQGSGQGHKGTIYCLAASEDGKYVVTGGKDKLVGVWEVQPGSSTTLPRRAKVSAKKRKAKQKAGDGSVKWVKGLLGHKDAVTSVSIPPLSNPSLHFLSTSLSRLLCLQSLSTLSTIDTFFGHQDSIASVSAIKPTMAVTSGGRDRTARWWKVEEEIQLVFRGGGKTFERNETNGAINGADQVEEEEKPKPKAKGKDARKEFQEGSMDVVCILDDSHFLSGGDSGSICLWHTGKKKPIFTAGLAHGVSKTVSESEGSILHPRGIASLAALRGTDLFASGSSSGQIKIWAIAPNLKSFVHVFDVAAKGFVNSLQILAVPPRNVQPDKWISDRLRRERADESRARKKERRRIKRHGDPAAKDGVKDQEGDKGSDREADAEEDGDSSKEEDNDSASDEEMEDPTAPTATLGNSRSGQAKAEPEILLFASLAREPRLGRWDAMKGRSVRNGTLVVHLGKQAL